jgi:uncharacterized membrane protein YeaQ/YmgE (transglycosylase-associated protein family)
MLREATCVWGCVSEVYTQESAEHPIYRRRRVEKMGIITWIIVGLIAGALAKLILPGDDPGGIIVTILIGIAGAFVGGFVFSLLGGSGATGFNIWSIIVATIGAIILLAISRLVASRAT